MGNTFQDNENNRTFVAIVQSGDFVRTKLKPLQGVIILSAGDLKFTDIEDNTYTVTFPTAANGGSYPFDFKGRIRKIFDTGTTLTDAQMLGYH